MIWNVLAGVIITMIMGFMKKHIVTNKIARLCIAVVLAGAVGIVWELVALWQDPTVSLTWTSLGTRTVQMWLASLGVWSFVKPFTNEYRKLIAELNRLMD